VHRTSKGASWKGACCAIDSYSGSPRESSPNMRVAFANPEDLNYLAEEDHHIGRNVIEEKIARREIIVAHREDRRVGFLRYGYFWDEIPFMNLLWVRGDSRGKGYGTQLISFWEEEMHKLGYDSVMTSTLSNERAQHLYRRLGYEDVGSLLMPEEPLEIVFLKRPHEGA
jgi:ribosomal protein S18 acetylase RimI-like enzyme